MTTSPLAVGRRRLLLGGALSLLAASRARAQAYPSRPIKLVLPNSPGSAVDGFARKLAPTLAAALGQPLVIDNQPGSGGLIGINQILRSPRDGYTIGMVANSFVIAPSLYKLPYDPHKDIQPVAMLTSGPFVLMVNPSLGVKSLAEFVALAKARPANASLTFGSPGVGTPFHLAGELLAALSGANLLHVPYKSANTFVTDLVAGQVDVGFLTVGMAIPFLKSAKLRALGTSTLVRSKLLPELPTLAEAGLPQFDLGGWQAMVVASGTPKPIVQQLNAEVVRAMKSRDIDNFVTEAGSLAIAGAVDEARDWFNRDFERYAKLTARIGIKPE